VFQQKRTQSRSSSSANCIEDKEKLFSFSAAGRGDCLSVLKITAAGRGDCLSVLKTTATAGRGNNLRIKHKLD
ncbi:hypothetical protein KI387_018802, partial [Taxus chinensis]